MSRRKTGKCQHLYSTPRDCFVCGLYGATVQNFKDVPSVQGSIEGDRIRFDKLVIPYATTYAHLRGSSAREIRGWDGSAPRFLSYQASIWGEMKPDRIVELHEDLGREYPGRVEFVRADHYFNLYNQANHLPFNLVLSPKTSVKAGVSTASPDLAADGTPATLWASPEAGKQWLEFDFGEACQIVRYVIRHAGASGMSRDLNARSFMVQARADDGSWTTIDVVKDNTGDVTDIELDPVNARHIKITVADAGADSTARISEVEIYGRIPGPGGASPGIKM